MKTPIQFLLVFLVTVLLISCEGDTDDMGTGTDPDPEPDTNPIPDKISTYEADVKIIMSSHCTNCHSNPPSQGAPMSLETYQEVVSAVNNRDLFGRVSTTNMNNVMPESGRLPDATILKVDDWIADGLKEN